MSVDQLPPPLYFKQRDIFAQDLRDENKITAYEVCMSAARVIPNHDIEGAQQIRGLWKIYTKSPQARAHLLTEGFTIRKQTVILHNENPFQYRNTDRPTEKVTIQDIPLNVPNSEIENLIQSFNGVQLASKVKYCNIPNPNGGWSEFKNGDRFCYIYTPIAEPLPKQTTFAGIQCHIYHKTQKLSKKLCRICKTEGHKENTTECPLYQPELQESIAAFRSPHIFSNFHACNIKYNNINYHSVEQAYLHTQATSTKQETTAQKILQAENAREAKLISKELQEDKAWDTVKVDVMEELIKIKTDICPDFKKALMDSENLTLVEATGNMFWASGLSPSLSQATDPKYYPGENNLGKILMKQRNLLLSTKSQSEKNTSAQNNTVQTRQVRSTMNKNTLERRERSNSFPSRKSKQATDGITKFLNKTEKRDNSELEVSPNKESDTTEKFRKTSEYKC
jgi:ribA/ribD-fused uncharacterized protein